MALGKVYKEIAGIQFNERSQVLAAAGYPRGKFFVELLFDLDEGHNRMLIQLIQKTAGKGVGRREGRKLGRSALHDAGSVQGMLGPFFYGFRINERLLVFVWQRIEAPFFFPGGCSELFNPLSPDPCVLLVCLEWWPAAVRGRGERRKCSMRENMIPAAYLRIISVTTDVLKRCVAWECFLTRYR